jgi:arylsulfatase A-like enzyme
MERKERPNILVIMTEHQQGWTVDPKCQCQMPNVKERIAGEGIRFNKGYTPNALCAPARASFFSGLYPSCHGMYNNYHSVPVLHSDLFPNVALFSENLRRSGYNLSFIGKWHVSGDKCPADFGWEGPDAGKSNLWGTPSPGKRDRRQIQQSFDHLKRVGIVKRNGWADFALYGTRPGRFEDMTDFKKGMMAIDEIKRLSKEPAPWVVYVGLTDIHDPYIVTEPYASMYNPADIPLPPNYNDSLEDKPAIYRRMRQQLWSQLTEEQIKEAIAYYWGLCSMNDDVVGMILDAVEDEGVSDETLVLYTSDHGDQVGSHGLFLKGVLPYEESYNIPMAVRFPSMIKSNSVCSEFVTLCDFAQTFCDITDSDSMSQSHGRSLVPIFDGNIPDDWAKTFFGQFLGTEYYYTQRIIRDQRYKYVFNGFDFDELYDLENDLFEMKNLAQNSEYDGIKRHLIEEMWRWCERTDDIMFNPYPTVALVPFGPMII